MSCLIKVALFTWGLWATPDSLTDNVVPGECFGSYGISLISGGAGDWGQSPGVGHVFVGQDLPKTLDTKAWVSVRGWQYSMHIEESTLSIAPLREGSWMLCDWNCPGLFLICLFPCLILICVILLWYPITVSITAFYLSVSSGSLSSKLSNLRVVLGTPSPPSTTYDCEVSELRVVWGIPPNFVAV